MSETTIKFARKPLATAVMCSVLGVAPAAFGATIDNVNTDNLAVPPVEGKTLVYTDTEGTASFGWIEPATDFDTVGLGISVYNEAFSANGTDFAGCVMAETNFGPADPASEDPKLVAPNCLAESDSGKRFKLKATTESTVDVGAPIDLVFDVTSDGEVKNYRVIGKLSNLTPTLLGGFSIQLGFGLGEDFLPSSAGDGLSLGNSAGPLGRYPGGLFGGSPAEGLPFFSTEGAFFELDESNSNEDKVQTLEMPYPYYEIFGSWLQLEGVPTAWFYDHDGNPSNDPILLAYDNNGELVTYEKTYTDPTFDPASDTFAYDLANRDDLATVIANLTLTQRPASEVFAADGDKDVTVEGVNYPVAASADWPVTPVTVIDATDSSLFATWNTETELYDLAGGGTLELDAMNALIGDSSDELDLQRVAGYVQGPIEDLANVNINATINVGANPAWTGCAGDGVTTTCQVTLRISGLSADQFDAPTPPPEEPTDPTDPATPTDPEEPTEPESRLIGNGSGCTVGTPGSPFDPVLPGMVLLALAGLWARKRRADA